MPNPREAQAARQALLDAADRYVALHRNAAVIVAQNAVDVVVSGTPAAPAEGVSDYDQAILDALRSEPQTARRLARRAGRTFNGYFRQRVSRLVDEGRIRRTARGLSRPQGG